MGALESLESLVSHPSSLVSITPFYKSLCSVLERGKEGVFRLHALDGDRMPFLC